MRVALADAGDALDDANFEVRLPPSPHPSLPVTSTGLVIASHCLLLAPAS